MCGIFALLSPSHDRPGPATEESKGLTESIRQVLGGEEAGAEPLAHGRHLNLVLNALNRLEARGRDSAGIAVYARFANTGGLERFVSRSPVRGTQRNGRGRLRAYELMERGRLPACSHLAVTRPDACDRTLLFAYKSAQGVVGMGANVRLLREAIGRDGLLQGVLREPGVEIQALAHASWTSNSIVGLAGCHPVDSTVVRAGRPVLGSSGAIVAAVDGAIDNHEELFERYVRKAGFEVDQDHTYDAKLVPLVVLHHYRKTGLLEEAFRLAFEELEGSMAVALMAADRPGVILLGQKGSGQCLFFGLAGSSIAIASEVDGLTELAHDHVVVGEGLAGGGEVIRLAARDRRVDLELWDSVGERAVPLERLQRAGVAARERHRGGSRRFDPKGLLEPVGIGRCSLRA